MKRDSKKIKLSPQQLGHKGGNMKQENKLIKFTNIILLVTVAAMILVAGTYAKYTSTASGTDSAVVAKWSFEVKGEEIAVVGDPKTINFDLFNTIYDTKTGEEEKNVATGLIAPGTTGSFEFTVQNTSEVTAQYAIDFNVINSNKIPIQYSTDGKNWSTELADIVASKDTILPIGSGEKAITVKWRWLFDGDDTAIGKLAAEATKPEEVPQITIEATIIATQLNNAYEFYYSDIQQAIAAINSGIYDEEQMVTEEEASIGVYIDNKNIPNLVVLKDIEEEETIEPTVDMIINLNGHTITSKNNSSAMTIRSGNVTIDGRVPGSTLETISTLRKNYTIYKQ